MGKRIYVADDEKNICFLIQNFLEKEGFEVQCFEDGASLLKACAGMTGKQLCAVMWPENTDDVKNMDYLRHLVGDLKKALANVGPWTF